MMEIVEEFAAELPGRAEEIESTLAAGDSERLRTLAHQLKGAGGSYGFDKITEVAAQVEDAIRNSESGEVVAEHTKTLCEVLRAVVFGEGS